MVSNDFAIVGAGGFGRELRSFVDMEIGSDGKFIGFIDDNCQLPSVLSSIDDVEASIFSSCSIFLGIGSGVARLRVLNALQDQGLEVSSFISSRVICSDGTTKLYSSIGSNFMGGCSISNDVSLGDALLIQSYSVIGHDSSLADGVTVGSFAFLSGFVQVGRGSVIHPHACILPGVSIGEGCTVGAGSVVLRNVPDGVTVFGNPAKKLSF